jgi:hypothetical protein
VEAVVRRPTELREPPVEVLEVAPPARVEDGARRGGAEGVQRGLVEAPGAE